MRGVELRIGDIENDEPDKLKSVLKGIDTVISAVTFTDEALYAQKRIINAARDVGVKRYAYTTF